jgi:hypothetical protein
MRTGVIEGGVADNAQAAEVEDGGRAAHHHGRALLPRHHGLYPTAADGSQSYPAAAGAGTTSLTAAPSAWRLYCMVASLMSLDGLLRNWFPG